MRNLKYFSQYASATSIAPDSTLFVYEQIAKNPEKTFFTVQPHPVKRVLSFK